MLLWFQTGYLCRGMVKHAINDSPAISITEIGLGPELMPRQGRQDLNAKPTSARAGLVFSSGQWAGKSSYLRLALAVLTHRSRPFFHVASPCHAVISNLELSKSSTRARKLDLRGKRDTDDNNIGTGEPKSISVYCLLRLHIP